MTFMPCSVADGESCPALWACCMASRATATAAAKAAAAAAAGATRLRKRCMLTYAQEAHAMQPLLFDRRHNTSVISRRDCGLVPVEAVWCVCGRCIYAARGAMHSPAAHTLWGRGGKLRAGCGTEKGFQWLNQPPLLGPLAPDSKSNADKGLFFASIIDYGGRTKCNRMSVVKQAASQVFTDA